MLEITSIKNGIVIDHIQAGVGVKIFKYLKLDTNDCSVALIINADSKKLGKKDIIKIENCFELDYTVLGLLSPTITICEVKDEMIINKVTPTLPDKVENIIKCKNPSCITSQEEYVPHSFILVDKENGRYRCEYCDEITKLSEI
ncbi:MULTISPECIES: aspartate carbamoyltransferase regulatory subunit [Clostridium]|jgi:aspartate carbamoyltransferase regulatory subunit|uniref:Aspartate carbamoyltransferase regulatory chain n=4 Tax=Clostridium TaxID=1485 RepID=A0A1B9BNI8_CLOBE|nr:MULTISPECIES: aspartate carbamoyltransferase regulatory subunit [Clostridium]ABR33185.1 aspartate transcarbamylase regulatory subunit [Clostridium beijerinckii NCIMB 8052]AIU00681.1 aspartate carbamoyltransferase regulatory subunit [Clostridium beijerinckii ATCC 35702]ALB47716.1 aspartate carbamoyltransferase regulatory subunit [Clostridium beijerinckii NRRL B-598]AQS03601.1 aspartate carbamoyltransferase regulatory chain [Clostridium beijerinckii]AVK50028.1 aspartate carbamoyltransferase r